MKELMETPEFVTLIPEFDEQGEPFLKAMSAAQNRWVNLMWLAEMDSKYGNLAEAELNYREALNQTGMFDNSDIQKSKTLLRLANCLYDQQKQEEAEEIFSLVAELDTSLISKERRDLEDDFVALAEHYLAVGEDERAESLYLTVLEKWRELLEPSDPLLARCLNGLGIIYGCENRWHKSEQSFQEAIDILEGQEIPRKAELASVIENLANLYAVNNDQEKAAAFYSRALALHEEEQEQALANAKEKETSSPSKTKKPQKRVAQIRLAF
jgi:tetratricopeptide (TPR) repeat protein